MKIRCLICNDLLDITETMTYCTCGNVGVMEKDGVRTLTGNGDNYEEVA